VRFVCVFLVDLDHLPVELFVFAAFIPLFSRCDVLLVQFVQRRCVFGGGTDGDVFQDEFFDQFVADVEDVVDP
jgi:hypothetical protein